MKHIFRVWLGDNIVLSTPDEELALTTYNELPSGKNKAPSKRRTLEKIEVILND